MSLLTSLAVRDESITVARTGLFLGQDGNGMDHEGHRSRAKSFLDLSRRISHRVELAYGSQEGSKLNREMGKKPEEERRSGVIRNIKGL